MIQAAHSQFPVVSFALFFRGMKIKTKLFTQSKRKKQFTAARSMYYLDFFLNFLDDISPLGGGHCYPCFGPLVMSALGSKARVDPLTCVFHHLHATESSDSPLVQHLLTYWQPAWQPSCSNQRSCKEALVGLESGIFALFGIEFRKISKKCWL